MGTPSFPTPRRGYRTSDVVIEATSFAIHPRATIARGEGWLVGSADRCVVQFVLDPRIAATLAIAMEDSGEGSIRVSVPRWCLLS